MKQFVTSICSIAVLFAVQQSFAENAPNNNSAAGAKISVTAEERAKIEEVVHQYLLQKPEVILEAVQNYQRKQYEQAEQTVKKTQESAASFAKPLFHQNNDPVVGNPNGKITVVEFFDYQCPHCVDMAPIIEKIIKSNGEIRLVFKEFPIRGPVSDFAARAALAANKQGKYYEFSHALLIAKPPLTQDTVLEVAKDKGLDVAKLKKDMDDKAIVEQIKNNVKLAQDLKLFGTPAFFIGKTNDNKTITYSPGRMDENQLQDAINKAKQ